MHSPADVPSVGSEPAKVVNLDADVTAPHPLHEPESFLATYPDVHFIDLLIADMNGIVRGKRIDRSALTRAFERGIALPPQYPGHHSGRDRSGDGNRRCRPHLPADPRHPVPGTLAEAPYRAAADDHVRAGSQDPLLRRPALCPAAGGRAFPRTGPQAGLGLRAGVLPDRPGKHHRSPAAAALADFRQAAGLGSGLLDG